MKVYRNGKEVKEAQVIYTPAGKPAMVRIEGVNFAIDDCEFKVEDQEKKTTDLKKDATKKKSDAKPGDQIMTTGNTLPREK